MRSHPESWLPSARRAAPSLLAIDPAARWLESLFPAGTVDVASVVRAAAMLRVAGA
jgi:hypothetical protein